MPLPNCLIVGAPKSGTTALHSYLSQLPDVYSPAGLKESHFFLPPQIANTLSYSVRDFQGYQGLFSRSSKEHVRLDSSVYYLGFYRYAIPRVERVLGSDIHIIACLRDPIERAYSAYLQVSRYRSLETRSFLEALTEEDRRMRQGGFTPMMYYSYMGMYASAVAAFAERFPNIHIVDSEQLRRDPRRVVENLASSIGIQVVGVQVDYRPRNVGGDNWRSGAVGRKLNSTIGPDSRKRVKNAYPRIYRTLRNALKGWLMKPAERVSEEAAEFLVKKHRHDVVELRNHLGYDLSFFDKYV